LGADRFISAADGRRDLKRADAPHVLRISKRSLVTIHTDVNTLVGGRAEGFKILPTPSSTMRQDHLITATQLAG